MFLVFKLIGIDLTGLENSIGTMPNLDLATTVNDLSSVSELLEATLASDDMGSVLVDLTSIPATLPKDSTGIIGKSCKYTQ